MALDRWIALFLLGFCLAYGYTAWFAMDGNLAPFMRRNPIWPSTFPKVLSVMGIVACLIILLGLEKSEPKIGDIDYRRLWEYKLGQALLLLGLMVVYALILRPAGFLGATICFLAIGSMVLGERRALPIILVNLIATYVVWFLVHIVLGIFMLPLPEAIPGLNAGFIAMNETLFEMMAVGIGKLSLIGGAN